MIFKQSENSKVEFDSLSVQTILKFKFKSDSLWLKQDHNLDLSVGIFKQGRDSTWTWNLGFQISHYSNLNMLVRFCWEAEDMNLV